jgi:AcrR family transcriptional regulator
MAAPASTRRTQAERTAESEQRLLDAAIALIAEQGFEKTTVAQIGKRAGYSHSLVNVRFGSKEGLIKVLFRARWQTRLVPEREEAADGLERVVRQVDHVLEIHDADRDGFRAVIMIMLDLPKSTAHLMPWYHTWVERYYDHMIENLQAGVSDGSIRGGLDHRAEAERFVAYATGLCFTWALDWNGYDISGKLAEWREHLRQLYSARSASAPRGRPSPAGSLSLVRAAPRRGRLEDDWSGLVISPDLVPSSLQG